MTPDTRRNLLREGEQLVSKAEPGLKPRSCNHGFPARPESAALCSRAAYQTWSSCPATGRGEEATSLGGFRGLTRARHIAAPHPVVYKPISQTLALVSSRSSFEVSNIISILEIRKMMWNLVLQPPGVAPSASRVFITSPPTCLKQHSDSQTRGPRHPREAGNGDSRKTVHRAHPAPQTQHTTQGPANRQPFSMCVPGAGGGTRVPSLHIQDSHLPGKDLWPAQVAGLAQLPDQGRCWLVQPLHCPGERGLEKDLHGPLFSMQSVHPEVGRMHRAKLRTPDVLAGPSIS